MIASAGGRNASGNGPSSIARYSFTSTTTALAMPYAMPQPAKLCLQGNFEAICRFSPECVAAFWMIFGLNPLGDEVKAILDRDELVLGMTTAL
jgi:hypothetical protein